MSVLLALALAQAAKIQRYDHTDDLAVVAKFLSDVRAGRSVDDGVAVEDRAAARRATVAAFASYANDCAFSRIDAMASATGRMPIMVTWDCGRFKMIGSTPVWEERFAEFWIGNGQVRKVIFGKLPTIEIRAPR